MAVQPETLDLYDDRQLVAAFQAGEGDAFERIVSAHYASLLAEARRKLRSSGDAEDAVQETLLRAYLALDRFGGEYRLRAWLSRILTNACADARARRSGELRLFDRLAHRRDEVPGADEGVGDSELRRKVKEAIASLPETYRMAFVLREVEERPYAEVAEEMSVTESNARARVHRARNSLTRALRDAGSVLGGFAIPIRLLGWRWLASRSDPGHKPHLAPHHGALRTSVSDMSSTAVHSAALPATSQVPLSALSQVSQALTQSVSSPLSQTILAIAPDAGRASLPVAGVLATMAAAGAAMVATGASVLSPAAAQVATVAAPPAALTTYSAPSVLAPSGDQQASTTATTGTNSAGTAAASATSASDSSQVATQGSDAWQWVTDAATDPGGVLPATPSSVSGSSASQSPTQTSGTSNSSTSTDPVPCPWPGSFSGTSQGTITLPAPEPAGTTPSAYFASDTLEVGGGGPAFEVAGQGNYEEPSGSLTVHTLYGACLRGTTDPILLADLSNQADSALGQLQLAGALVGSSSADGESVTLYRGTATWLDGPNVSNPTSAFAAEVVLDVPSDISMLRVAFFGTAPDLSGALAKCASQEANGTSTGTTPVPSTSTGTTSACDDSSSDTSSPGTPTVGSSTATPPPLGSGSGTSGPGGDTQPSSGTATGASGTGDQVGTTDAVSAGQSAPGVSDSSAGTQNDATTSTGSPDGTSSTSDTAAAGTTDSSGSPAAS
jgi:RNA polymerase sigma-70 factor (ECF subfamily)